mmetsp:Transcript_10282/g.18521  ORF Transcript_10282/g.18521 Transcript_10282/m.18521 type:complete len:265 (+) Transcript_10282:41-835(+)
MSSSNKPLPLGGNTPSTSTNANKSLSFLHASRLPEYLRRALNVPQMDLDYTFWQMIYLCRSPSRVYRTTKYHKQTKNQWARDDPGFVTILVLFMTCSSIAYAVAFHRTGFGTILRSILYSVFIEFGLLGIIIASINWWLSNTYLRIDSASSSVGIVEQKVEWLYAFDVHCNSFFPLFLMLYIVQYLLLLLILRQSLISVLISNSLYAFALSYYCYITFLGFDVLPFLQHTVIFLYPVALIGAICVLLTIVRVNISHILIHAYYG